MCGALTKEPGEKYNTKSISIGVSNLSAVSLLCKHKPSAYYVILQHRTRQTATLVEFVLTVGLSFKIDPYGVFTGVFITAWLFENKLWEKFTIMVFALEYK